MVNFEIPWHSQWEEERLISMGRRASDDPGVVALWDAIEHDDVKELQQMLPQYPHVNFVREMNDGYYSPLAEAYYSNSFGAAEEILKHGGLPILGDRYHLKVYTLRDFLGGKGFNFTYSGENRKKWEVLCEMEEALHEGRPVKKKLSEILEEKSSGKKDGKNPPKPPKPPKPPRSGSER